MIKICNASAVAAVVALQATERVNDRATSTHTLHGDRAASEHCVRQLELPHSVMKGVLMVKEQDLSQLMPFRSLCYRFGNPGRPLPNRTLGGTNLRADMAPVRSDMAASGCSVVFGSSSSDSLPSSVVGRSWTIFCFELWSPIKLARRRDSLFGILADDLRLLWPGASFNSDRLPSMPSLVIPKK